MIRLRNLSKVYRLGEERVDALKNISLDIQAGEFVAIMGRSGSGKSTLLQILGLLDVPTSGSYQLFDTEVSHLSPDELAIRRRQTLGFIFQQFHLLPRLSAVENVAMPVLYSGGADHSVALLRDVGLANRLAHKPAEMSGGQQQRVAIARALVNNPNILLADEPTGNLDTASQKEILNLLKRLNQQGIAVIVVTHDEEVAKATDRIIRMGDGEVMSDRRKAAPSRPPPILGEEDLSSPAPVLGRGLAGGALAQLLREAFRSVLANKLRSALSTLGITIGVASVIAMLALGGGAQQSIEAQLKGLGANVVVLRPSAVRVGGIAQEASNTARLAPEDVDWLRGRVTGIKLAAGNVTNRAQATYGNKNWNTFVQGTSIEYASIRSATPFLGRMFTAAEDRSRARVALLGLTVVRELYGAENPIGTFIKINKINFQVIGVMPEKGAGGFRDQDDTVVIPLQTAMHRLMGKTSIDSIDIESDTGFDLDNLADAIKRAMNQRHHIPAAQQDDAYQIMNLADIRSAVQSTSSTLSSLLASIAAVSLLVGGIGIMNIMLVSVTERTREIGLRKAVGAQGKDILLQFLVETLAVSLSGGLLGVILGVGVSLTLSVALGWVTLISGASIALAVAFSILVGLVFGIYPARKAARLSPIEALRSE